MFNQMLQGFQRKTVPFTIVVGLFLLTCSFYEAIWQTPAAHFVTYCVPALLFVAFATGDRIVLQKLYPEWDLQVRLPGRGRGTLLWYCTRHGLFYQYL